MRCLLRRNYDAAHLIREHPPRLRHPHKQLVYELCGGAATTGAITVTRWGAAVLPKKIALAPTEVVAAVGGYDYADGDRGIWHVNFADPRLFVAYGSPLFAQDELQAAEHPILGSIREALLAEHSLAVTEVDGIATPILVIGAERRCTIETAPNLKAGRPHGLYGNQFAVASADVVRRAVRIHQPSTRTNLIAIAAPVGSGTYTRSQLERILVTAVTGFAAAVSETQRAWSGAPTEVRTGFWGCGAFGGNRQIMVILQLLAARLTGIARLRFYTFDDVGRASFAAGSNALDRVLELDSATSNARLVDLIERIAQLGYAWGTSDGN